MLVVKKSQLEDASESGTQMATILIPYYAGTVLGQFCAAFLYENSFGISNWSGLSIREVFIVIAITPIFTILPGVFFYPGDPEDSGHQERLTFVGECSTLVRNLCEPSLYLPLLGFCWMNLSVIDNAAHSALLIDGCGVSEASFCLEKVVKVGLPGLL